MDETTNPIDDNTETETSPAWAKIEAAQNYLAKAVRQHDGGRPIEAGDVLGKVQAMLVERPPETDKEPPDIASGAIDYWAHVAKRKETVGTGLKGLNGMLGGGLEAQRLMILLGAPGGGKTTLANQMAVHAADSRRPVLYVTSEDIPFNLLAKTLARQGKLPYDAVLKGYTDKEALIKQAIETYRESLAATRLRYLDATMGTSLSTIRECAQAHFEQFKEGGSGILVIDYLQRLARAIPSYRDGRQDLRLVVTDLMTELRAIAGALDCCVLALAAQHRASGYKATENALASGKESGDIEYTADVVMAIGDDNNENRVPTASWLDPKLLRIDKNRQGALGCINLDWYGERQQFTEAAAPDGSETVGSNGTGKNRGRK